LCPLGHRCLYFNDINTEFKGHPSYPDKNCDPQPNGCKKGLIQIGYHCRTCRFDLCVECGKRQNIMTIEHFNISSSEVFLDQATKKYKKRKRITGNGSDQLGDFNLIGTVENGRFILTKEYFEIMS
jgi:hypothetical protein